MTSKSPTGSPARVAATVRSSAVMVNNVLTFNKDQLQQLLGTLQRPPAAGAQAPAAPIHTTFKAKDIGFSHLDNDADLIETKEGKTIYYNIFSLTERLRVKKSLLDDNANASASLAHNLEQCLLDEVDRWYTSELS